MLPNKWIQRNNRCIGYLKPGTKTVRLFYTHTGAAKCACKTFQRAVQLLCAKRAAAKKANATSIR